MISYSSRWYLIFYLCPVLTFSQLAENVVVQPAINISWRGKPAWKFNTAIEQRTTVHPEFEGLHVQVAQFASVEVGFYGRLGLGAMYREVFDQAEPEELRTTQQYVRARTYNNLKIAQRLRWDQRWRGSRLTHRWRYRLSGSIPLAGEVTDPSEYYITGGVETLFVAEADRKPLYDQRLSLGIGRQLSKSCKLQLVGQYRWEDFTATNDRSLFINLAVYKRL
jgi:hypothetical protein